MVKESKEYVRLKSLFDNVDPAKRELVDDLLYKVAFIKGELDLLEVKIKKYGSIEVSNKGNVRESIYYKTYLTTINTYQSLIRTLNTVMGKNVIDEDDEFDEFIKRAGGV